MSTPRFFRRSTQAHVAAEDQTVVVEQAGGGDGHCPAAAESAEVVDGGSAQAEVSGGSDATMLLRAPPGVQVETAVTGDGACGSPVLAAADQAAAAEQLPLAVCWVSTLTVKRPA